MMKKKKNILIIMGALIIVLFGVQITYSLLTSTKDASTPNEKIAKFVFEANQSDNISISLDDLKPSDYKEYAFSVTNSKNSITSDVTINYQITIKTLHFIPLVIELYKEVDDNEELVLSCLENNPRNNKNELVCVTENQVLSHNIIKNDNYKLKISFPSQYNSLEYTDLVDYIDLEINSWQKTESQVVS